MEWTTLEVTTTQFPGGYWRTTTLASVGIGSVFVYRVSLLNHDTNGAESSETWEFTNAGDARKKYREER